MDTLTFTVDSALLGELGEKLVETVHLALVELVKNSYDADATFVEIIFTKDKGKMQIVISDNGTGMNHKAVDKYWMRIATTHKRKQKFSKMFGRPLSGAKGIGRFSCRRLGGHLKIITKGTANGYLVGKQVMIEKTVVNFPWSDFVPGEDVTTIKCLGAREKIKDEVTGTTLVISNVAEEWTNKGYNWLKRQLAVLAANRGTRRKGFNDDPGFNVKIIAPDFESGEITDIREKLINAGWGTLTAEINGEGRAVCKLETGSIGIRNITSSKVFSNLRDVKLKLAILVDDKSQIRDASILNIGTLEKILPEWGGVQVKHKGVRVYPYGDDDWLEIDKERGNRKGRPDQNELFVFAQTLKGVDPGRSLLNMLGMQNYVGNVEIGEEAEGFEPKISREGFVSSASVDQLKEFVRFAIDWSTILRDFSIREETLKQALQAKERFEQLVGEKIEQTKVIESALTHLNSERKVLSDYLPPAQKKKFEAIFEGATEVIQKQHEANQVELTHLRLVASTSTLLLIFSHEVKSLLGVLETGRNSLTIIAKGLQSPQKKEVEGISNTFGDLKDRLSELLSLTSLVGGNKKTKAGNVALLERVKKVEKVFELVTQKYDIDINYGAIPNNIVFKNIMEAEVYSVLLNIMSNSIKSVIAQGKGCKIQLSAERSNGMNVLTIRDNGIGLEPSRFEEVFIPFISDPDGELYENLDKRLNPEDNMIVGSGSGLGLGIVKEIINARGGSIKFVKPTKGWNAELEIKLP